METKDDMWKHQLSLLERECGDFRNQMNDSTLTTDERREARIQYSASVTQLRAMRELYILLRPVPLVPGAVRFTV